ncbi:MAG: hypothetical protein HLUCCO02_06625 [Idiomarinaceae bacterium HL-53]|nr:MAG: hypothetical protein HLUCCO02_06625 [Idiomarinaceae bacterium HL-53]
MNFQENSLKCAARSKVGIKGVKKNLYILTSEQIVTENIEKWKKFFRGG